MSIELVKKLAEAKKKFKPIEFNKTGNYKNKFANLENLVLSTVEGLSEHGLTVYTTTEAVEFNQKLWMVITAHLTDGVSEFTSSIQFPFEKALQAPNVQQQIGANLTYGRRYTYSALLNLAADDDLDGNDLEEKDKDDGERPHVNQTQRTPGQSPIKATTEIKSAEKRKQYWAQIKSYCEIHGEQKVLDALDISDFKMMNNWDDKKLSDRMIDLSMSLI